MQHNIQGSKKRILEKLNDKNIKFEVSDFPSGCCMIDIWKSEKFYVIQIEPESIGISLVEVPDLSTIPDEQFYDLEKFLEKLNSLLSG